MEDIIALFIPMVGFVCLVGIVKVITDNRVRRRMAETHATEDLVRSMLEADERNRQEAALKWGLVAVLVGLSFGLIDIFNLPQDQPGAYGLVIAAAGFGLIAYHLLRKSGDGPTSK